MLRFLQQGWLCDFRFFLLRASKKKAACMLRRLQDNGAMKRPTGQAIAILERAAAEAKLRRLDEDRP